MKYYICQCSKTGKVELSTVCTSCHTPLTEASIVEVQGKYDLAKVFEGYKVLFKYDKTLTTKGEKAFRKGEFDDGNGNNH